MSIEVRQPTAARRRSWIARWFGSPTPRPEAASPPSRRDGCGREAHRGAVGGAIRPFVADLLDQQRHAFALLKSAEDRITPEEAALARAALDHEMALIPAGRVPIVRGDGTEALAEVAAFRLDRHAVTNRQFARFVAAGCYDDLEIWPREILPSLLRFTDRTNRPGPAGWSGGTYPAGLADHPVVGISWHEATAYARWVGKRLPTAAEWQKAVGWPEHLGGGSCTRYPWGDLFDPARTNLWASGVGQTVPVDAYPAGDTPNGIRQMTGNVWEWLDDPLNAIPCRPGEAFHAWRPMRRIVGGAFDTYLPAEATCHFITGQPELDRRANIGFRCAISADQLRDDA